MIPPQQHATITLSMGGAVHSVSFLPGDYVRKNQVILTLENPEFIALQQTWLDAAAQTEFLEKEYLRQQNLASHEAASQKRMQQSKAEYLSMKSRLDAAAAANVTLRAWPISITGQKPTEGPFSALGYLRVDYQ